MDESKAAAWIFSSSFDTRSVGTVGVELEWISFQLEEPRRRPAIPAMSTALGNYFPVLPHGSVVSFEPGGQVEISSRPYASIADCIEAVASDLRDARARLASAGIGLVGCGLDRRMPQRLSDVARYAALEQHYDRFGIYGRIMMCNAASVQVSVDAGDDSSGWRGRRFRWWLANALGPVLLALFANSPRPGSVRWPSTRQVYRFRTDPTRTDPLPVVGDPRALWTEYVLQAQVVGVRDDDGSWIPGRGLTLRDWLNGRGGRGLHEGDVRRHVKTVIPPVRPCGRLELRMIDSQPDDRWQLVAAMVASLLDEPQAARRAASVVAMLPRPVTRQPWLTAATAGLADPSLAWAASECLAIAAVGGSRIGVPRELTSRMLALRESVVAGRRRMGLAYR